MTALADTATGSSIFSRPGSRTTPRRPLPRRRSELGLIVVGGIVVVFASLLPSLALTGQLPAHEITVIIGLVAIGLIVHFVNRRFLPDADPVLLPIALVLNGLGYVFISRLKTAGVGDNSGQQLAWTVIGVGIYVAVLVIVKRSRDLERYRYIMLAVAFGFLVAPLLPGIGENINGARLWIHLGTTLAFQPVEIAKILLIFFFASYVIDKRELLTYPSRRVGNHLTPDLRAFGPIGVASAMSLLIVLGEHDIGFSLLLFVVFLSLLWVSTGRWTYLAIGIALFLLGTFIAAHFLPQLNARITLWFDPWKYFNSPPPYAGAQPVRGELAFAHGGLFGTGLGLGLYGGYQVLPAPTNDFIFSIIGEELGLVGTTAVAVAYLFMVGCGVRAALGARSEFAKLVAIGLTMLLGFQAFLIMGGVTRILPLTGVTLPFVSYGGSSLVANYALLAIIMRISQEGHEPDPV
ncbi:MAG TPA: FtsW/RodA/SpoVE family cell cycle protein [Acidimicrobiales bacterium]|nr:FtsW/RodA/SpoVE family cell cycle protein [Acidimicrobiales bacterium]